MPRNVVLITRPARAESLIRSITPEIVAGSNTATKMAMTRLVTAVMIIHSLRLDFSVCLKIVRLITGHPLPASGG